MELYVGNTDIIQLTSTNFNEKVKKNDDTVWVIQFYKPGSSITVT